MKAILGVFTNRWFLAVLGLIFLALLIWIIGPLIGLGATRPLASPTARWITILVIVVLWALNQLRKQIKASKATNQMVEGLVEPAAEEEPDLSAEEVETLKQRFEEAMQVLKKTKGKSGARSLYDLPWYMIIGPPGSGKTTALVNSGLNFPLADRFGKEALRGVGGTRNCDWWFTDDAIMLDTAGRYVTQDSHAEVDSAAWEGFLNLLKKYRKRRPINGVIVAISLSDLMLQSESERNAHISAIKNRIQELDSHFGIRFPVYVLLTKCDLVAGFMEFFDDLGRDDRRQVWGVTFPIEDRDSSSSPIANYGSEFDALIERLNDRVLWRLSQERDIQRRALIHGFPRQIAALKDVLDPFLQSIFRGSRFEDPPMVRGVYFTSGTQEGTPIDRLMGSVARAFGLDQQAMQAYGGQGRSYFITNLLKRVIFNESELAGTNRSLERKRAWLQRAAYLGTFALTGLALFAWVVSFINNTSYIETVRDQAATAAEFVDAIPPQNRDPLAVLPALNAVRDLPSGYGHRDEGTPWLHGFGLFQGDKLGTQATAAYRDVLVKAFLPRIILRMEDQLRDPTKPPDYTYEALKAYLMLDSKDHYSETEIAAWMDFDWSTNIRREVSTEQREQLIAHLSALLEKQPVPLPLPLLDPLILDRQLYLQRTMTVDERIYNRIRRRLDSSDLPNFNVYDEAGPQSQLVFQRASGASLAEGIPGLFTKRGYREEFLLKSPGLVTELAGETWILGEAQTISDPVELTQLANKVKQRYLEDFLRQYESLVNDIELAPFSSVGEAARMLNILSNPESSPLLLLLRGIERETSLEKQAKGPSAIDKAGDKLAAATDKLEGILGGQTARPALADQLEQTGNVVDQQFASLNRVVGDGTGGAPIDRLLGLLKELSRFMATVDAQSASGGAVPPNVLREGQGVMRELNLEAENQPSLVGNILNNAADGSRRIAFGGVRAYLNEKWRDRGLPFCRQAIAGRYPINRGSQTEIRLDDFGAFFGFGGIVDQFFQQHLREYVDTSRSPWRVRSTGAAPISLSAQTIAQFERANAIKETFFRGGGSAPSVSFDLIPVGMDDRIDLFTLNLEGKPINYDFGPTITSYMQWPGPGGPSEVRLEVTPPAPGGGSMQREMGPWAWFRVLDRANITPAGKPEQFEVTFDLGGRWVRYQLIARSAYNPFRFPQLEQFSCPERF